MATSGSTDFSLNTNELIVEAFDLCGIGSEGEPISADMYARAKRSLNLLVKAWGAKPHLWTKATQSVTLTEGTASYALSPRAMRVLGVRRKVTSSGVEVPLTEMSRQEYDDQPNKSTKSVPTQFYFDPQVGSSLLYIWPTASAATASAMTLQVTYLRRIQDFDGTTDDPDFPQEWLEALTTNLASLLALKYGVAPDIRGEIQARAADAFAQLSGWDTETAPIYLQMDDPWSN